MHSATPVPVSCVKAQAGRPSNPGVGACVSGEGEGEERGREGWREGGREAGRERERETERDREGERPVPAAFGNHFWLAFPVQATLVTVDPAPLLTSRHVPARACMHDWRGPYFQLSALSAL